jgi:hypothetical protein
MKVVILALSCCVPLILAGVGIASALTREAVAETQTQRFYRTRTPNDGNNVRWDILIDNGAGVTCYARLAFEGVSCIKTK